MPWYKTTLSAKHFTSHSAKHLDGNEHGSLADQFARISQSNQNPKAMALFSSGPSVRGDFNYYFTPACEGLGAMKALMEEYGAVPCEEPTRDTEDELGLEVGDSNEWLGHTWYPDLGRGYAIPQSSPKGQGQVSD